MPQSTEGLIIKIISYNLRFASESDPQPWSRRREPMIELLTELAPDVLGAQEGLDHQLADLMAGLGDHYRLISEHRHDGGTEENSAVIYDSRVVEPVTVRHRWLSDTPDVPGSKTWGHTLPRMYTVVEFRRLADDRHFQLIATHFDHESEPAQIRSAELLIKQIAELDQDQPLILLGDFNAGEDSEPYRMLINSGLRDGYLSAADRGSRTGTFNNYGRPDPDGTRIDWILINDSVTPTAARIVDQSPGGQYPSDHLPVEAVVDF
jgi:endonuclease/exonuclease/phosphatase family metal-dependent hydrolase